MHSSYSVQEQKPKLKDIISKTIINKNHINKKHSDSLNCLINCAEYSITLYVNQGQKNGKSGIYINQRKDKFFSPLFFYDTSPKEIIQLIENKNISENFLNLSHKIKTENEIIKNYEQNEKNKILLFNHIKFPLTNINYESNNKTQNIKEDGKCDINTISNFSNSSYSNSAKNNNNYSLLFDIQNVKNAEYLFSINDIKSCEEMRLKFNGNIHEQKLFKNDIIYFLKPYMIINSIQNRMKKYINLSDKEIRLNLYNKFFFAKINDEIINNIGILFSFNKKKDISKIIFDEEYIMKENYKIIKIFFCVDIYANENNFHETKYTSRSSSKLSNLEFENSEDNKKIYDINYNVNYNMNYNKNYNNNNFYYTNNNLNNYYNNDYYNNASFYNYYNNNYQEMNNNYNNYNNISYNANNYDSSHLYYLSNENQSNYNGNYNSFQTYDNFNYNRNNYYETVRSENMHYSSYNHLNKENKFDNNIINLNSYNNDNMVFQDNYYELNTLFNNLKYINNNESINISSKEENNSDMQREADKLNDYEIKTIFLDLKNELIQNLFEKNKQDNCISNYTILKKRIDINTNIEKEKLKKIKLKYFFNIFQNINYLSIVIPLINEKGKLIFNELTPTLSSMRLILKTTKKTALKIIKRKNKNFNIEINKKNLLLIEYKEIKPPYERDLLYNKINEIKQIIGENKLCLKNVLLEKSYFCILWRFTKNKEINSSVLAYYSFDFKLIGIFIIYLKMSLWLSSFSYDINNHKDYKKEYDKNTEIIKEFFKNMSSDKESEYFENLFTQDYRYYIKNKNN